MQTVLAKLVGKTVLFANGQCVDPFRPTVLRVTPAVSSWISSGRIEVLLEDPQFSDRAWAQAHREEVEELYDFVAEGTFVDIVR